MPLDSELEWGLLTLAGELAHVKISIVVFRPLSTICLSFPPFLVCLIYRH